MLLIPKDYELQNVSTHQNKIKLSGNKLLHYTLSNEQLQGLSEDDFISYRFRKEIQIWLLF